MLDPSTASPPLTGVEAPPPTPFGAALLSAEPGCVLVSFHGELDLVAAGDAERALSRGWQRATRRMVVDLNGLDFMDSTGARLLCLFHARGETDGRQLVVLAGEGMPRRVLELLGLLHHLTVVLDCPTG